MEDQVVLARRSSRFRRVALAGIAVVASAVVVPLAAQPAGADVSFPVPVRMQASNSNGQQYIGSTAAHVSADGRWFAFSVPTFQNPNGGSYVKDLLSGTTTVVSLNQAGKPANDRSDVVGISSDGSSVAFLTGSTNMGGTSGAATFRDLYVRNRTTNTTTRANFLPASGATTGVGFGEAALSIDGKVVTYASGDTHHVYRRVLATGATLLADTGSGGVSNGVSSAPAISGDGRYVTYTSTATNLVTGDVNAAADVFRRDTQLGQTVLVSTGDNGKGNHASDHSSISYTGSRVSFDTDSTNLVDGDTNVEKDVYFRDLATASTYRVSVASNGTQGNGDSSNPSISGDGRYVAFQSAANSFEVGASTASTDTYVRDTQQGFTKIMGMNGGAKPNGNVFFPQISGEGTTVVFDVDATNLISGDTNGGSDAYALIEEQIGPHATLGALASSVTSAFGGTNATALQAATNLTNGRLTPTHHISNLAHTSAWAKDRGPVARLYQAFFLREPDLSGLNHWVNKHKGGLSLSKIAGEFAKSNEFKTKYGSVDNTKFVELVYGNVLQRKADSAGLTHWVAKLQGGLSRGDAMVQFSESSEGKRFLAPAVDATLIGLGMFRGNLPTKALWNAARQAAHNDHNRAVGESVALVYLTSADYTQLIVK